MFEFDLIGTIRLTSLLVGISLLIGSLEQFVIIKEYRSDGLFSWDVFRTHFPEFSFPVLRSLFSPAFNYRGVWILLCGSFISALILVIPVHNFAISYYFAPIALALLMKLALAYRNFYGADGSDQMETIVLAGLCSALCLLPSKSARLGIWFIAGESALSYFASGVSKLFSRAWITGEAVFKIFNTYTYGHKFIASWLRRYSPFSAPLCWLIIIYECAFPLCLILPVRVAVVILCIGFCFHIGNAFIMGLNKFFWAFLSTYPALLYCNREIASWIASR